MKKTAMLKTLIVATAIAAVVGCNRNNPIDDPSAPVDDSDIVNVDDILLEDAADAAAAAVVGDPATLLGAAQEAGTNIRGHLRDVFGFMKRITENNEPTLTGNTERGDLPFALWTGSNDGIDIRFTVVRTGPARLRYLLQAKQTAEAEFKNILTGVFVKRAANRGGGRLHINLSNLSDVRGADVDGSVHVVFANGRDDKQGRRIAYLNLRNRNDPDAEPQAFGADLIRIVGEGGRFRTLHVGNLIDEVEGAEAMGLRVLWKTGEGGRADAVIARVAPRPVVVLGHAHECFDADGLRTGYADTFEGNDDIDPNEGDVRDCLGFGEEEVPEGAAENGTDNDPELDELLAEDGALDIDEDEAEEDSEVEEI